MGPPTLCLVMKFIDQEGPVAVYKQLTGVQCGRRKGWERGGAVTPTPRRT